MITDKTRALQLLKELKPLARRDLRLAVIAGAGAGLAIIAQAWLIAWILGRALFQGQPLSSFVAEFSALVAIILVRAGCAWLAETAGLRAAFGVVAALRRSFLSRLNLIGQAGLAAIPTGQIVATVADATRAIEPFFSRYLPASAQMVLLPGAIICIVAPLDWRSFLIFLITAPLIPLFMVLIGKGAEVLNQRQWLRLTRLSGHFLDAVQGLSTIRAFGAGERVAKEVGLRADAYRRDTMQVLRLAFLSALTLEFFASISIAMAAVFIGFRLLWGQLDYTTGLFILLLAPEFYLPLRAMGTAYHARMEALGAADQIARLEDLPALEQSGGTRQPDISGGISVRFDRVHLDFGSERTALDGIDLAVPAGATVALSGPSGAGKSSVLALLAGFVQPQSGSILINGVPLAEIDLGWLRTQIAYAPQRPRIFADTVAANIALGQDVIDPIRLQQAVCDAGIADLIAALHEGLETRIGEGGRQLSGGESHRIALARAFYRNAPLVLLDEPTAHLDEATEAGIHDAIDRLRQGRTVLIVAHRARTLDLADQVVAMAKGRIAEEVSA